MIILTLVIGVFLIPLCLEAILPLNLNSVCFTITLTFGYILNIFAHLLPGCFLEPSHPSEGEIITDIL